MTMISKPSSAASSLAVKVCGLRDRANIEALLRHLVQPDFLGFIFYPTSPRFVGDALDADFMRSLSAKVGTVGVFVDATSEEMMTAVERFGLHAIQLHGTESSDLCLNLREQLLYSHRPTQIWKAFRIASEEDIAQISRYNGAIDLALLDTKGTAYGGNGTRFDWSLLETYTASMPFFLSGGIAPEHAREIKNIQHPRLLGIDINSRFETAPALKDVGAVHHFLDELKS